MLDRQESVNHSASASRPGQGPNSVLPARDRRPERFRNDRLRKIRFAPLSNREVPKRLRLAVDFEAGPRVPIPFLRRRVGVSYRPEGPSRVCDGSWANYAHTIRWGGRRVHPETRLQAQNLFAAAIRVFGEPTVRRKRTIDVARATSSPMRSNIRRWISAIGEGTQARCAARTATRRAKSALSAMATIPMFCPYAFGFAGNKRKQHEKRRVTRHDQPRIS